MTEMLPTRDVPGPVYAPGWGVLAVACASGLVGKLPAFNGAWPVGLQARWFDAFDRLLDRMGGRRNG
jgi:hypothetical protein